MISLVVITIINFSLLLELQNNTIYLRHTFNQSQSNFDLISEADHKINEHITDVTAMYHNITNNLDKLLKSNK